MIVAYYYDDEDPSVTTHVGYDWFPRFGTIWFYYDNEWAEVWTKYSKRYVDAESFVTQDPENRGMTWIVNESGTWELGPAGGLAVVDELPPIEDAVYGSAYFLKAPWFDEENQVFYDRATYSPAMNDEGAVDHYVITGMPSDNAYDTITRREQHIYDLTYSKLDYDFAKEYSGEVYEGLCSAFVKNGVLYRNYDWTYDDAVSFTVYTPATPGGRHAVVGVAGTFPELTTEFVDSGAYSPLYKVVPYRLVDGINDAGVAVCHLVCPFEDGDVPTTGTYEGRPRVNARYMARYILDKADNFYYAVQLFLDTNWFVDDKVREGKHEFHYLITDGTNSAICYFRNNQNKVERFDDDSGIFSRPIMTNFRIWYDNQPQLKDGKYVYAPGMDAAPTSKGLTPNAGGVERYNEIVDIYENDSFTQREFVSELGYTHVYTDKLRASDLVGIGTLTIDSPISEFESISAVVKGMFVDAERDGTFWQTVHTSVYNCTTKALRLFPQEMDYNSPVERRVNFYDYKFPVSEGHWIQRIQNIDDVYDDEKSIALESDTGLARYKSGGKWVAIDNKIYITYYDYRILKNKNELIDGVDYIIIDPTL